MQAQERTADRFGATLGEEIASAVTHGIGAALSIAGLTLLLVLAILYGDGWRVLAVSIFGGSMVFLYLASTLYHGIQSDRAKSVFLILDHVGICLLIAGTYTPFLLVKMRDVQGWTFFAIIWGLAITGALLKAFFTGRYRVVSTLIYVAMGWLALFLGKALIDSLGWGGALWLLAGGIAYSLGTIPFLLHRIPYNHAVWHLFVIAGTACHFVAVLFYVLPTA